ncbi:unnamed protein product [Amoebophrya sp. A25]|nr:unnamed protein product [Amoebophrya sp. A25]|eukprot:GSA25T00023659001.1
MKTLKKSMSKASRASFKAAASSSKLEAVMKVAKPAMKSAAGTPSTSMKKAMKMSTSSMGAKRPSGAGGVLAGYSSKSTSASSSSSNPTSAVKITQHLSTAEADALKSSLYFMHVPELRSICAEKLGLPQDGTKDLLVQRIAIYVGSGSNENKDTNGSSSKPILQKPKMPASAKLAGPPALDRVQALPTKAQNFMVYGVYKNDLVHRMFFQKHLGPKFHFTAAGIKWLNAQWHRGVRPRFQDYIDFWTKDQAERSSPGTGTAEKAMGVKKSSGAKSSSDVPKKGKISSELATLQFNQFQTRNAGLGREEMLEKWENERMGHKKCAEELLQRCLVLNR